MNTRVLATVIIAAAGASIVCLSATGNAAVVHGNPTPVQGTVTRVVDGDTFHVSVGGHDTTIRLLGADTPETHNPHILDPNGHEIVQCGGPQATMFAHQQLDGKQVTLTGDPTQADTDHYHRLLRYIQLPDGTDYSTDVAAAGWARPYVYAHKPTLKQPQIAAAVSSAQAAHRGIWGLCQTGIR